jgi:hypothetical protein
VIMSEFVDALRLPLASRLDRRVPKKLLLEHGAPTSADKRYINEGIEEIRWMAALKPDTIGVPAFRNAECEYVEIALIALTLRPGAKGARLMELLHRAIPYPVLLLTNMPPVSSLSVAHKRWALNEGDKMVLDGEVIAIDWENGEACGWHARFLEALALERQLRTSLRSLYQGWLDLLTAALAARRTDVFAVADSSVHSDTRREALRTCARLDAEIERVRAAAAKEKQMPRLVNLNAELKKLETERVAALQLL